MLLKSLNEACELIQNAPNVKLDNITTEFEEACTQIINNLPAKAFIIEHTIVTQAINLLNYFQMHKLIFSQYQVDISLDFETNIEIMIKENLDKIVGVFEKLQLHKLGIVEIKKARNYKSFSVFHRVSLDLIKSTISLGDTIQCLAIDLNHYIQHLTAAEINQRANKRTRESPELTSSPKAKKETTESRTIEDL